jgi:hypothetical protein
MNRVGPQYMRFVSLLTCQFWQVQRLIAVLSIPAVTRGTLLTDGAPSLAAGLPEADAAVLQAAGWTAERGLRALLNFTGGTEQCVRARRPPSPSTVQSSKQRTVAQSRELLRKGELPTGDRRCGS